MATQAEIQVLINQIVPNGQYKAIQMQPLLTSMLEFGAFWSSSVAGDVPTVTDDSDSGYKAGSVGYNSNNSRAYVCSDPTVGAAVWSLLTDDKGVEVLTMTNGATVQSLVNTTAINLAGSVTNYTLKFPANPYTGKQVTIFITGSVSGTLTFQSSAGASVGALTPVTLDTYTFAWSGSAWIQVGFAGTIV